LGDIQAGTIPSGALADRDTAVDRAIRDELQMKLIPPMPQGPSIGPLATPGGGGAAALLYMVGLL